MIKSEQPDDPEDLSAAQTFIRAPGEPHTAVPPRLLVLSGTENSNDISISLHFSEIY